MSAADIQQEINKLKADILVIEGCDEILLKDKILCINTNREMINNLEKKIQTLTPQGVSVSLQL